MPSHEEFPFRANGQEWLVSWHAAPSPPKGTRHGSAGICLTASAGILLVSADGLHWDFPAGRPAGAETWEDTLRREIAEEACASVVEAHLLGFSRGRCVRGAQAGLVLVRAIWRARVVLGPWKPAFEIRRRRLVRSVDLMAHLESEGERLPIEVYRQALRRAGLA